MNVTKRYLIAVAAHNLGRVLRKLIGIGKPRTLQGEGGFAAPMQLTTTWLLVRFWRQAINTCVLRGLPSVLVTAA